MNRTRILLLITLVCLASCYFILMSKRAAPFTHPAQNSDGCSITRAKCQSAPMTGNFLDIKEKRAIAPDDHFAFDPYSEGLLLTKQHSRWGYRDASGKIVIPAQFKQAKPFREHRAAVEQYVRGRGLLWGFIDPSGHTVVRSQFRQARNFSEGLAAVEVGQGRQARWAFIDLSGKTVIPAIFHDATEFSEGLASVSLGKRYGYIDHTGNFMIAPQFEHAFGFADGRARISSGDRFGYIDRTGLIVIPTLYDKALDFSEQRAAVLDAGLKICRANPRCGIDYMERWGYIDTTGKQVVPFKYQKAESFSEGLAAVTTYQANGNYIDKDGNVVIVTNRYHGSFYHGLARIGRPFKTYIDQAGSPVASPYSSKMPPPFLTTYPTANACSYVTITCLPGPVTWKFFDINGKRKIVPDFARWDPFDEKLFAVNHNSMYWGYRDRSQTLVIPLQFYEASAFREHRAAVKVRPYSSIWGFIDPSGKIVVPPQFRDARPFSEGLAAVEVGHGLRARWGFVDLSGKMVIPARFRDASEFSEGLAAVRLRDKYGYIGHSGKFLIAPQFASAESFSDGRGRVDCWDKFPHTKFGYVNKTGKLVIPCRYANAQGFAEGRAAVLVCHKPRCFTDIMETTDDGEVLGHWGYIDTSGKMVVQPLYLKAESFSDGLAAVTTEEFDGYYIDKDGRVMILTPPDHESFLHGIARIGYPEHRTYIDKTGRQLVVPFSSLLF